MKLLNKLLGYFGRQYSLTDEMWFENVEDIAGTGATRELMDSSKGYLQDPENWSRLSETNHGMFLREITTRVPDYLYRNHLRNQVIAGKR